MIRSEKIVKADGTAIEKEGSGARGTTSLSMCAKLNNQRPGRHKNALITAHTHTPV
jgi:hypothetical protein